MSLQAARAIRDGLRRGPFDRAGKRVAPCRYTRFYHLAWYIVPDEVRQIRRDEQQFIKINASFEAHGLKHVYEVLCAYVAGSTRSERATAQSA